LLLQRRDDGVEVANGLLNSGESSAVEVGSDELELIFKLTDLADILCLLCLISCDCVLDIVGLGLKRLVVCLKGGLISINAGNLVI
jgi:hypothetical protein